ncbi:class I SAM-dependent methyltransferase [Pirellulaceae bacterium]|nr:class I SAM-dependent methyltransferase [Pirellulaceae bacterium]
MNEHNQLGDPRWQDDPNYQAILRKLDTRYGTCTEIVSFGESEFYFTKVTHPHETDLEIDDNGEMLWQPYWAEDWQSSRAICWLLMQYPIRGTTVLDLGCGLGLTGAVAAERLASVCLADNAKPALEFAKINCWNWMANCTFKLVDWKQTDNDLGRFDWIVGAEIIYDQQDWPHLSRFWRRHLNPGGTILLCDPFRRTGRQFREWVISENWHARFQDAQIPGFPKPINVIELQLSESPAA